MKMISVLIATLLSLTACTAASEDAVPDDLAAVDPTVNPANEGSHDEPLVTSEEAATKGSSGAVVVSGADSEVRSVDEQTVGEVWESLSQDARNGQCSAHVDNRDTIWEDLSSDGRSATFIEDYQFLLDDRCNGLDG